MLENSVLLKQDTKTDVSCLQVSNAVTKNSVQLWLLYNVNCKILKERKEIVL